MSIPIFRASAALASASAGRGWPRSSTALPLPTMQSLRAIGVLLLPADFDSLLQPLLDQFDIRRRRGDPALRLLLKRVQHEHAVSKPHRVHRAKGVAAMVRYNLQNARSQALQRLGRHVL